MHTGEWGAGEGSICVQRLRSRSVWRFGGDAGCQGPSQEFWVQVSCPGYLGEVLGSFVCWGQIAP